LFHVGSSWIIMGVCANAISHLQGRPPPVLVYSPHELYSYMGLYYSNIVNEASI
jgi:hypothetical protein